MTNNNCPCQKITYQKIQEGINQVAARQNFLQIKRIPKQATYTTNQNFKFFVGCTVLNKYVNIDYCLLQTK